MNTDLPSENIAASILNDRTRDDVIALLRATAAEHRGEASSAKIRKALNRVANELIAGRRGDFDRALGNAFAAGKRAGRAQVGLCP